MTNNSVSKVRKHRNLIIAIIFILSIPLAAIIGFEIGKNDILGLIP